MKTSLYRQHGITMIGWLCVMLLTVEATAQSFRHDSEGRLIEARYGASHIITYRYDSVGNLTNLVASGTQGETDTDGDGMADAWELVWFDSLVQTAAGDFNQDTVSDLDHYLAQTDPVVRDSDGDGAPNVDEVAAGTDPLDAGSVFAATAIHAVGAASVVRWWSKAGRRYSLQRSVDMLSGFVVVQTNIPATPPLNVHTDHTAEAVAPRVYRLRLE